MRNAVCLTFRQLQTNTLFKMHQLATHLALVKQTSQNLRLMLNRQRRTLFISLALVVLAASPSLAELGDSFADLVYTPVTPCRVLDSRFATDAEFQGPFQGTGNSTNVVILNIAVNDGGDLIPDQGGNTDGCPEMPTLPEAAAVVLTITAVPVGSNSGHFRAYAYNDPDPPLISVTNWHTGSIVANTTIVPACENCGRDVSVRVVGGPVHLVIDVMGFFRTPEATPLETIVKENTQSVTSLAGITMWSPACPSGWKATGGGFHAPLITNYGGRAAVHNSSGSVHDLSIANAWLCEGLNNTVNSLNVTCSVVCARIPGWTD